MKLRLAVARFGEMDGAKWWNTKGVLSDIGAMALRRGFPKSHVFARARIAFAVAAQRCQEVYDPPDAITLWKLPAEMDEQIDDAWARWLESPDQWIEFLKRVEEYTNGVLLGTLADLSLVSDQIVERANKLKRANDFRSVPVRVADLSIDDTVSLLAAGFCCSEPGKLAVPYARLAEVQR
jgi:hypothetical protein